MFIHQRMYNGPAQPRRRYSPPLHSVGGLRGAVEVQGSRSTPAQEIKEVLANGGNEAAEWIHGKGLAVAPECQIKPAGGQRQHIADQQRIPLGARSTTREAPALHSL